MWSAEQHELAMLPIRVDSPAGGAAPGGIPLAFSAVEEPQPGERWLAAFTEMWPAYRAWYLKDGESARPNLRTCRRMLSKWMPELVPTFQRLVELSRERPHRRPVPLDVPAAGLRHRLFAGGLRR